MEGMNLGVEFANFGLRMLRRIGWVCWRRPAASGQFLVADFELSYFFANFQDLLFIRGVVVMKHGVAGAGFEEGPWLTCELFDKGLESDHVGRRR